MIKYITYILFGVIAWSLSSCGGGEVDPRFKVKPKALGIINDLVIVADDELWGTYIQDTALRYLEGFYPLTPAPEPIFDIRHYTLKKINSEPLLKELRTYVILSDLSADSSIVTQMVKEDLGPERFQRAMTEEGFNTSVGKDKWAVGQLVIYLFGRDREALAAAISENVDGVTARINQHDNLQLTQLTYGKGENQGLARELSERYEGAQIVFPRDYVTALDMPDQNNLIWMRKNFQYKTGQERLSKDGAMNIAITMYDYTGPGMVSKEAAKERFNLFGKNVSSAEPDSYVMINDVDLPILEYDRTIDDNYVKEYRGIWEMENDFMGGPFISYSIVNQEKGKLLSIDAFVYSPGKEKRDFLQQIDTIVKSIKWD